MTGELRSGSAELTGHVAVNEELSDCLFQEGWWLDAVAPGKWQALTVKREGRTVGRMPVVSASRWGLRTLPMPPLTKALGPIVRVGGKAVGDRQAEEEEIVGELITQLPKYHWFSQLFSPTITNWYPFYQRGFSQRTLYTYRFESLENPDLLWAGFAKNVRRDIRQAEKALVVRQDLPVGRLYELIRMTFRRQGVDPPFDLGLLERIDAACRTRGAGLPLFAEDASGVVHAGAYVVYDRRCAYWLLSGTDPRFRSSNSGPLLVWSAIQRLAMAGRAFDFEGSMRPGIARFYRRFGAAQTPYFHVWRGQGLGAIAAGARQLLAALGARGTNDSAEA